MNIPSLTPLVLFAALAAAATGAQAIEAEQFEVPPSVLSRAEVLAELKLALASDSFRNPQDAQQQPFAIASTRSRDEVREEARAVARAVPADHDIATYHA